MVFGETHEQWVQRAYSWRLWFAWRPVMLTDGRWAWWQQVERRRNELSSLDILAPTFGSPGHSYRLLQDR